MRVILQPLLQLEVMTQKTAELVNTVDEEQVTAEERYDQEMR